MASPSMAGVAEHIGPGPGGDLLSGANRYAVPRRSGGVGGDGHVGRRWRLSARNCVGMGSTWFSPTRTSVPARDRLPQHEDAYAAGRAWTEPLREPAAYTQPTRVWFVVAEIGSRPEREYITDLGEAMTTMRCGVTTAAAAATFGIAGVFGLAVSSSAQPASAVTLAAVELSSHHRRKDRWVNTLSQAGHWDRRRCRTRRSERRRRWTTGGGPGWWSSGSRLRRAQRLRSLAIRPLGSTRQSRSRATKARIGSFALPLRSRVAVVS